MKILVIGDGIIDKFTEGYINRFSPESKDTPIFDVAHEDVRFGGAFNVAKNLKSLNIKNDIFVASPFSRWTANCLYDFDINIYVDSVIFSQETGPSEEELVKERIIDKKTEKQIIRIDNRQKFEDDIIESFTKEINTLDLKNFDAIVVSDYNKGSVDWFVVDKIKKFPGPIFVDTKKQDLSMWKDFKNLYLKINWTEFESCVHSEQIKNLIVTHGKKPVQLRKYGQLVKEFKVKSVKNPDVVGSGDVFLAGLVTSFMNPEKLYTIDQSIEYAIKAASINCKKQGTCTVNGDELK